MVEGLLAQLSWIFLIIRYHTGIFETGNCSFSTTIAKRCEANYNCFWPIFNCSFPPLFQNIPVPPGTRRYWQLLCFECFHVFLGTLWSLTSAVLALLGCLVRGWVVWRHIYLKYGTDVRNKRKGPGSRQRSRQGQPARARAIKEICANERPERKQPQGGHVESGKPKLSAQIASETCLEWDRIRARKPFKYCSGNSAFLMVLLKS